MPLRGIEQLPARLRDAIAELERLRSEAPPARIEVQELLASIDAQFDAWLELLLHGRSAATLSSEVQALVERALLQLAVLRSHALALDFEARGGGRA